MTGRVHPKKVAIVCDWLTVNGGAEKVLQVLLETYPGADIVTLVDNLKASNRGWLKNTKVITSKSWPLKLFPSKYRWFLPTMPFWIEQFDLSDYDVVISCSHAVAKGVITHPQQVHIAYIYSPMRYAWDLQYEHFDRGDFGRGLKGWLIKRWLHHFRIWDTVSFFRPDQVIASSNFIAKRIKKVTHLSCPVIYPPVIALQNSKQNERLKALPEQYYVIVSRLVPYKNIDKVIEAFRDLPQKNLVIVGDGPLKQAYQKTSPENVFFLGYLSKSEMISVLSYAQASIHMAVEDFGIAPLEAQSLGVPVIAYQKGALKETILSLDVAEKPTGLHFARNTPQDLIDAIYVFEEYQKKVGIVPQHCIENSQRFSVEKFQNAIRKVVDDEGAL
ncbi:glycosyl transferase [Thiosulfatimonas sediminis]|uniref:Glycosyl transferase n=1 Tax=Thiosulfatimonas sediminis TaxID=2675054 RepID=A0A6F8PSH8_9GAMM|nr:glycosyltransferase [Thiosulfatimonas sediminis]BBP45083.1 glycosyl transferase [Thiosulfatimonas sediminis]